ncbi:MAG TPA: hypothetical protein VKE51_19490 [Vicinamibacterales bacterium]|nr:hypothetical protein [Vicinamibacterales bacterium]
MSEHFLEEQLKRIREMTEQLTRLRNSAAELSEVVARERIVGKHDPLHDIRDFRTPSPSKPQSRGADEHAGRQHSRQTSRSRRR